MDSFVSKRNLSRRPGPAFISGWVRSWTMREDVTNVRYFLIGQSLVQPTNTVMRIVFQPNAEGVDFSHTTEWRYLIRLFKDLSKLIRITTCLFLHGSRQFCQIRPRLSRGWCRSFCRRNVRRRLLAWHTSGFRRASAFEVRKSPEVRRPCFWCLLTALRTVRGGQNTIYRWLGARLQ